MSAGQWFHVERVDDQWFVVGVRDADCPRGVPGDRFIAAVADTEGEAYNTILRLIRS